MRRASPGPGPAWEPLTPRGVAAFARAAPGRLLLAQFLVALLAAGVVAWFFQRDWFPVVRAACRALPATGEVRDGRWNSPETGPVQLAGNHYLALTLDADHAGQLGREAHLLIEIGREDVRCVSLLGYLQFPYPKEVEWPCNRAELVPRWGAWQSVIPYLFGLTTLVGLFLSWSTLAVIYWLPLRILAWLADRELSGAQAWRLARAALLPAALLMTAGIFAYAIGLLDLLGLGGVMLLHFIMGWFYLLTAPYFLPRRARPPGGVNPFQPVEKLME